MDEVFCSLSLHMECNFLFGHCSLLDVEHCPLEDSPPLGGEVKTADNSSKRSQMYLSCFYEVCSVNRQVSSFDERKMLLKLL
jgi:hypothetical protein